MDLAPMAALVRYNSNLNKDDCRKIAVLAGKGAVADAGY
jgi:hypothetical protein